MILLLGSHDPRRTPAPAATNSRERGWLIARFKRRACGYQQGETRGGADMGVAEVAGLVVRPAVTGTMRARKTKSRQHSVAKKQWIAYIGVAVVSTLLTKLVNDFIERRFADDDADVA
jgi:hypothetical protein